MVRVVEAEAGNGQGGPFRSPGRRLESETRNLEARSRYVVQLEISLNATQRNRRPCLELSSQDARACGSPKSTRFRNIPAEGGHETLSRCSQRQLQSDSKRSPAYAIGCNVSGACILGPHRRTCCVRLASRGTAAYKAPMQNASTGRAAAQILRRKQNTVGRHEGVSAVYAPTGLERYGCGQNDPRVQQFHEGDGIPSPVHAHIRHTVIADNSSLVGDVIEVEAHAEIRGPRPFQILSKPTVLAVKFPPPSCGLLVKASQECKSGESGRETKSHQQHLRGPAYDLLLIPRQRTSNRLRSMDPTYKAC
jgi:hypothetical protein